MSGPDVITALAKMTETALGAVGKLSTPAQLGQLLVTLFYIDRTIGGGFLHDQTRRLLDALMQAMEQNLGTPVGHDTAYVWYLATRYGKMYAEASTPSKHELIFHAFYSEFSEQHSTDADSALFRDIVEKVDYNEALFLAGLSALTSGGSHSRDAGIIVKFSHVQFHVVKSLLRKGEICIVSLHDDSKAGQVTVRATPALGRFADFVKLRCAPIKFD